MIYLSSSPGYGSYFWAWSPASSSWGYCYAGSTPGCGSSGYYYNNYYYPMALRCVVELS